MSGMRYQTLCRRKRVLELAAMRQTALEQEQNQALAELSAELNQLDLQAAGVEQQRQVLRAEITKLNQQIPIGEPIKPATLSSIKNFGAHCQSLIEHFEDQLQDFKLLRDAKEPLLMRQMFECRLLQQKRKQLDQRVAEVSRSINGLFSAVENRREAENFGMQRG